MRLQKKIVDEEIEGVYYLVISFVLIFWGYFRLH